MNDVTQYTHTYLCVCVCQCHILSRKNALHEDRVVKQRDSYPELNMRVWLEVCCLKYNKIPIIINTLQKEKNHRF